jgi:hypothetical protein
MDSLPVNTSQCFICEKEIPFSARYPERLCENCMKKAVDQNGHRMSFYNGSMSGGFVSYNESTKVSGTEHTCYVNGYECYADEAYMGGIVIVPTEAAKEKKKAKQRQSKKIRKATILISGVVAPVSIWAAYSLTRNGYFYEGFKVFDGLIIVGSISLLLFIGLLLYRYKILLGLAAGLYVATGFYTTYYFGYRNDAFLDTAAIVCTISAALLITYLLLRTPYLGKKMTDLQEGKSKGANAWVFWIIIPVFLLTAGYIFLSIKGEAYAEKLLATAPSKRTTVLVTAVREYTTRNRSGRSTLHSEALLQYTVNGNTLYRIVDNKNTHYTTGSTLEVQYVLSDPYLISVVKTVDNDN